MRWRNTALATAGAMAGAYIGTSLATAISIAHKPRRLAINDTPTSVGLHYRNISFPSRRGRNDPIRVLNGWLIPATRNDGSSERPRDAKWVVMVHGDATNRTDPQVGALGMARAFSSQGYGILMFDLRGCGESADANFTAGWDERLDVLGALDCLVEMGADRARIGIIGFSLGAVASLLACSTPGVAGALVSDSGFADLWQIVRQRYGNRAIASKLIRPGIDLFLKRIYGFKMSDVSPVASLSQSDIPALIIHGGEDRIVPVSHAARLAHARGIPQHEIDSGDSDRFWILPNAEHAQIYRTAPELYIKRVANFYGRHLAD